MAVTREPQAVPRVGVTPRRPAPAPSLVLWTPASVVVLQRAVGNRATTALIQRAWARTDNVDVAKLWDPSLRKKSEKKRDAPSDRQVRGLRELIDTISSIPLHIDTMAPKKGDTTLRIDMQGGATRGAETWANIQCQVGENSVAGVICPFDTPIETVKEGLNQALDEKDMLEWEREAVEAADEDSRLPGAWVERETADVPVISLPAKTPLPHY